MGKQRKGEFQEKRFAQRKKGPPGKPIFKKKQKFEKKPKPEKPSISEIEAKRDQIKEERAAKQKELKEKRTQRQKVMSKKTKKGQPVMKDRIEYLLKKIQESQ